MKYMYAGDVRSDTMNDPSDSDASLTTLATEVIA
jgi:hypothetical protein